MKAFRSKALLLLLLTLFSWSFASAQIKFNVGVSELATFTPKDFLFDLHFDCNVSTSLFGVRVGFEDVKIKNWYSSIYVGERHDFSQKFSIMGTIGMGYMSPFNEHEKGCMYGELGANLRYIFAPPHFYFDIGYVANLLYVKERPNYQGVRLSWGVFF